MPYPPILRDINGDPLPQVWDKEIGNWRPVTGDDYGQRVRILGADGHPIDTDNPLYVDGEVQLKGRIVKRVDLTPASGVIDLPAGSEVVLVDNFDLGNGEGTNVAEWGLFLTEDMRPLTSLLGYMEFEVAMSHTQDGYGVAFGDKTVFNALLGVDTVDDDAKALVLPGIPNRPNLTSISIADKSFTRPLGRYLRIKVRNNHVADMRLRGVTLLLKGYW